jgi:hypothetical protein
MKEDINAVLYIYEKMRTNADKEIKMLKKKIKETERELTDIEHLIEVGSSIDVSFEEIAAIEKSTRSKRIENFSELNKMNALIRMKKTTPRHYQDLTEKDSDILKNYNLDLFLEKINNLMKEMHPSSYHYYQMSFISEEVNIAQITVKQYREVRDLIIQENTRDATKIIDRNKYIVSELPKSFILSREVYHYFEKMKEKLNTYQESVGQQISNLDKEKNQIDRVLPYISQNDQDILVAKIKKQLLEKRRMLKDTQQLLRPYERNLILENYRFLYNYPDQYIEKNKLKFEEFENALMVSQKGSPVYALETLEKHCSSLDIMDEFSIRIQEIKNLILKINNDFSFDSGLRIIKEIYKRMGYQNYSEKNISDLTEDIWDIIEIDTENFAILSIISYIVPNIIREKYLEAEEKIVSDKKLLENRNYKPRSEEWKVLWA